MKKRIVVLTLLILSFFSSVAFAQSGSTLIPSEEQAYQRIIAMKADYPEGMRWTNDDYYKSQTGTLAGRGCHAFALLLSDAAFGTQPFDRQSPDNRDAVRVGDILRINNDNHTVIVLTRNGNDLTIAEGNYGGEIHWGRDLDLSTVPLDYYYTRYQTGSSESGSDDYYQTDPIEYNSDSDYITDSNEYSSNSDYVTDPTEYSSDSDYITYPVESNSDNSVVTDESNSDDSVVTDDTTVKETTPITLDDTSKRMGSTARVADTATRIGNTVKIHRFYNYDNGEHLFSGSSAELAALKNNSHWFDEGVAWYAPNAGDPVYRLHQEGTLEHLYTSDKAEVDSLVASGGWKADFGGSPAFYSGGDVPIYRNYQRGAGTHQLTTDYHEYSTLGNNGWNTEGTALRAVKLSDTPLTPIPQRTQLAPTVNQITLNSGDATIENTPSKYSIESDVRLVGSGTGYHAKIVAGTATSAVSFGIQYDEAAEEPYSRSASFLIENVASNNTGGQVYTRTGLANIGETYKLLLTIGDDGNCNAYVNGVKVGSVYNSELAHHDDILIHVEGSGRLNGDSVDAYFDNIKLKSGGVYSADKHWNTWNKDSNENVHSTDNYESNRSAEIHGTLTGLAPAENWDSAYDRVSGNLLFTE